MIVGLIASNVTLSYNLSPISYLFDHYLRKNESSSRAQIAQIGHNIINRPTLTQDQSTLLYYRPTYFKNNFVFSQIHLRILVERYAISLPGRTREITGSGRVGPGEASPGRVDPAAEGIPPPRHQ